MDENVLAMAGRLGHELARVEGSEALGPRVPDNPAELLAALLDFPGGVAIAELLESAPAAARDAPPPHDAAERLLEDLRARLGSLEPLALRSLTGRRAHVLPSAQEIYALARDHQLLEERAPERVARFADELGAPLRTALGTSLRQAQAHVSTLRWEIAHDVRALGPTADQLERLDAALGRAISTRLGELFDRLEEAAHQTFVKAALHAFQSLPTPAGEDDFAAWLEPAGWIPRYRDRAVRMARALFGHLKRNVEGLVRAAAHAEGA